MGSDRFQVIVERRYHETHTIEATSFIVARQKALDEGPSAEHHVELVGEDVVEVINVSQGSSWPGRYYTALRREAETHRSAYVRPGEQVSDAVLIERYIEYREQMSRD